MPLVDTYLFFNGRCAEAMRFYEQALAGRLEALMTYADSPDPQQCGPGGQDLVMHARLLVDGRALMASDVPPGQAAQPMEGFAVSLQYPGAADARRVFDRLAEGGTVRMPLQKTFFAESFGMVVDRFGTPWMVGGGFQTA